MINEIYDPLHERGIQQIMGGPTRLVDEFQNSSVQQWIAGEPGNYLSSTKEQFAFEHKF